MTDMEAKARTEQMLAEISLLQRMTPQEAGMVWNGDAVKRAMKYLTEARREGMEEAAKMEDAWSAQYKRVADKCDPYFYESTMARATECERRAAAIREKIDRKSTVVKNDN